MTRGRAGSGGWYEEAIACRVDGGGQDLSVGAGHDHSLTSDGPYPGSRLDPPLCIRDQPAANGQCVEPRPHQLCHLEGHGLLPVTHAGLAKSRGG